MFINLIQAQPHPNFCIKGGPRIISPTAIATTAAIKTAAAPTSLAILASGWRSGLAISRIVSKAVFRNSAIQTIPITNIIIAQS